MRLTKPLHLGLFLAFLLSLSSNIFAISLTQYRQKITKFKESIEYLLAPEDYLSQTENINNQREVIKAIRGIPENEKVEVGSTTFEVSHKWFFDKLNEFEKEPYQSAKGTAILNEIYARFSALETKLNELEKQKMSARTKDEDKQKLDEILKRQEFQKPKEKEETWLQRKWREFWEWVDSLFPKGGSETNSPVSVPDVVGVGSFGLQIVLYAAVIGLIGFLLYRFAPFFLKQVKNREKKEKKTRVILGETIAAEDTSHNVFSEAEKLALEGNLRGAIRKGYIALLCELSDRKIIGLARHKTNRDYLRDVKKRKEIYSEVDTLTGSFERNWYGFNQTDQQDWEEFRQTYKRAVSKT